MDEPKSLDSVFKEKIFRIPDYQRGYAWQPEQLKDFWEDLVNLSGNRSHYTGVLTLKQIPSQYIAESDKEFWLVDDHSYLVYNIVDGQQRLTTFIIFLQAFVDLIKTLPGNKGKSDESIYITENLNIETLQSRYLFKVKPTGDKFRTYKFGYTKDNPSYDYLRFRILGEEGGGSVQETFYTLNLSNAKRYFTEQLCELYRCAGMEGLQDIYKKLTKRNCSATIAGPLMICILSLVLSQFRYLSAKLPQVVVLPTCLGPETKAICLCLARCSARIES